jgi:hypothetical protein
VYEIPIRPNTTTKYLSENEKLIFEIVNDKSGTKVIPPFAYFKYLSYANGALSILPSYIDPEKSDYFIVVPDSRSWAMVTAFSEFISEKFIYNEAEHSVMSTMPKTKCMYQQRELKVYYNCHDTVDEFNI